MSYLGEAESGNLSYTERGRPRMRIREPSIDHTHALNLVEEKSGLVILQLAGVPGIVHARNEERVAECAWVVSNQCDATEPPVRNFKRWKECKLTD